VHLCSSSALHFLTEYQTPDIDLSVTIMTSTFWPMSHHASPCQLPDILVQSSKLFETFYLSRHTGRRLTWQPSLGNADVRVAFRSRTHDLNVATYALVVLLLFETLPDDEFLTYDVCRSPVDGRYTTSLTMCLLGNPNIDSDSRCRASTTPAIIGLR
jgi:hypothetical protein